MLKLKSKAADFKQAQKVIEKNMQWKIPYATSSALTAVAKLVQSSEMPKAMNDIFKRPTPWTLNGLFVLPAKKDKLVARVHIKNALIRGTAQENYLKPEVYGGARRSKGLEVALRNMGVIDANEYCIQSSHAQVDAYGNVSGAMVRSIISALGVAKRKKPGRLGGGIFVGVVRGRKAIWQRVGGTGIKPLYIITTKSPQYSPRLKFEEIAAKAAQKHFKFEFNRALSRLNGK